MSDMPLPDPQSMIFGLSRRWRGTPLWVALVALVALVLAALLWMTWQHEQTQVQESTDAAAQAAAADVRQRLGDDMQALQRLLWQTGDADAWHQQAETVLRASPEIIRIERRDARFAVVDVVRSPTYPQQFSTIPRSAMSVDAEIACTTARRLSAPAFSRSYFLPSAAGLGLEVVDLCVPQSVEGRADTTVIGTVALQDLLREAVAAEVTRRHEVLLVESDGTRLARTGARRGAGVFMAERLVDLSGFTVLLRLDNLGGRPPLIPNLSAALVVMLSAALSGVLVVLLHDVRRRTAAEQALAEALAFRKAMEDSLVTGLRARSSDGRITHVNAAFCQMVGFSAEELLEATVPPYWPPEMVETYARRQAERNAGDTPPREGHETLFMRRGGERFPVLIFEAPLVDARGRRSGWMSTVLDVSAQRRIEELSRQQQ
ncbi:MAG: hypothetical protein RLZZ592_2544, partial [Pseudomonadota bacterium]